MEILLTGNTCFVTKAWVEMAFPEDHVLITCGRGQPHPPKLRAITLDSKERTAKSYIRFMREREIILKDPANQSYFMIGLI